MNVARPEAKQGVNHDRASPYFYLWYTNGILFDP